MQSKGLSRVFFSTTFQKHLWLSAFFMVQLSHLYMATGKTIALNIWTFACKVISLLFNMLSRFVIAFLPRSKHLSISRLQSPPAVILEPKRIKAMTNLDNILKSRDITLLTKDHIVKAMAFPVVMYRCESWTIEKAEH